MVDVPEEVVVWEYIRWDGKYQAWSDLPILKTPDFNNVDENQIRWDMLAGNHGYPGDSGQVARIRYPFDLSLTPYCWKREIASIDIFKSAFLNYHRGDGQLLPLDIIVIEFLRTKRLPLPFVEDNIRVVNDSLERLRNKQNIDDFNAILFCRPTPGLPNNSYRVVEGTKRAIAYRVAQLEGTQVPIIYCYFGEYVPSKI